METPKQTITNSIKLFLAGLTPTRLQPIRRTDYVETSIFVAEHCGIRINRKNCEKVTGYSISRIQSIIGVSEYFREDHQHGYCDSDNLVPTMTIGGIYPRINVSVVINKLLEVTANIDFQKRIIFFEYIYSTDIFNSWSLFEKFLINAITNARIEKFELIKTQTLFCSKYYHSIFSSICLARLGFSMDAQAASELNAKLSNSDLAESSIFDLMGNRDGLEFWSHNYFGWVGEFNLRESSWNSKTLSEYLQQQSYKDNSSPSNVFLSKLKSMSLILLRNLTSYDERYKMAS